MEVTLRISKALPRFYPDPAGGEVFGFDPNWQHTLVSLSGVSRVEVTHTSVAVTFPAPHDQEITRYYSKSKFQRVEVVVP